MEHRLRVNGIVEESIVDGPGLRYVVFTQGCPHHCQGCHNPETHDVEGGQLMTVSEIFFQFLENPLLAGITFSGGEPFLQSAPLAELAQRVKKAGKNVVSFSGYTLEQLRKKAESSPAINDLLRSTDILIDGPYVEAERDLELLFRGSGNQRMLRLKDGEEIEAEEPYGNGSCQGN